MPSPLRILRSQRGMALLMALVALSLLYFIAMEVSYDSIVDYTVTRQQVERIKARYAAKAGVELSLLRIMLYKQAVAGLGQSLGNQVNMLDPIWQFPFMWPPTLALQGADNVTEVDKSMLNAAVKESLMDAQYTTTITPETGSFDLNDLGSDLKGYKKLVNQQVLNIFKTEMQNNEEFQRKYSGYRFEELVNNIADYIDEDSESLNGGDESAPYRDLPDKVIKMPPNRPLRTMDELHQVAGMTDELYNLLVSRSTIFGAKGINVNYASKDVLMSLDVTMTSEAVDKVIQRRSDPKLGGPFKDDNEFFAFLSSQGVNTRTLQESKYPFFYEIPFNFRIVSTGLSANVKRDITAIVFDYPNLTGRFADMITEQEKQDLGTAGNPPATPAPTPTPGSPAPGGAPAAATQKIQASKGRPTVVYWEEN
ncbi:MAG: general secretion pathway protein GspK [Bdellovibrionales bacterium]|nr:general secretion pathway protein GspK [Bdellovibrionales bacterium]